MPTRTAFSAIAAAAPLRTRAAGLTSSVAPDTTTGILAFSALLPCHSTVTSTSISSFLAAKVKMNNSLNALHYVDGDDPAFIAVVTRLTRHACTAGGWWSGLCFLRCGRSSKGLVWKGYDLPVF